MHLCKYPGCGKLVQGNKRYCEQHEVRGRERDDEMMARRLATAGMFPHSPSPNHDLYRTARWRAIVQGMTKASGARCVYCGSRERLEIHHPIPPRGDEELFFAPANREIVCHDCHTRITLAEVLARKRGTRGVFKKKTQLKS